MQNTYSRYAAWDPHSAVEVEMDKVKLGVVAELRDDGGAALSL